MKVARVGKKELLNDHCIILYETVDGHDVEERVVGGQSCSALLDQLDHRRDVGDLRGEGRGDGGLGL